VSLAASLGLLAGAGRRRVLACAVDGRELRAACVRAGAGRGDAPVVEAVAAAPLDDPAAAVAAAVERLRRAGARPPARAVLVLPDATPACLELPVDPARPLETERMQKLVRFELEPYLALQAPAPDARPAGGSSAAAPGAAAVALAESVCGYAPLGGPPAGDGRHRWLACGVARPVRDVWVQAFRRSGIGLAALYPLAGTAAAALDGEAAARPCAVLEVGGRVVGCARLSGGAVESVAVHDLGGEPLTADRCLDLAGAGRVWLSGSPASVDEIAEAIRVCPCERCHTVEVEVEVARDGAILGAARHFLGLGGSGRACAVPGRDAATPLLARPRARALAAVAVAGLALAAIEGSVRSTLGRARDAHARATAAAAAARAETRGVAEIEGLGRELERVRARRAYIERDLARREALVPGLLDALAAAGSAEVAVDRVREDDRGGFGVEGFALAFHDAQRFARDLEAGVKPLGCRVEGLRVFEKRGRLGLEGRGFELRIVPVGPAGPAGPVVAFPGAVPAPRKP